MSERMTQFDRATLTTEDPEFTAWVHSQPAEWWAKSDLSACRLGWAAMKQQRDEIKGQTLAALNEWACRYEPEMFEFLGLPDAAVAKFAHGMIEKIRADVVEAWVSGDDNADRCQTRSDERMVDIEVPFCRSCKSIHLMGEGFGIIRCTQCGEVVNATRTDLFGDGDGCDNSAEVES
jgi:hypothetical protein